MSLHKQITENYNAISLTISSIHMSWGQKMLLSVTAQLPGANGYSGGKVIFIDTEVLLPLTH